MVTEFRLPRLHLGKDPSWSLGRNYKDPCQASVDLNLEAQKPSRDVSGTPPLASPQPVAFLCRRHILVCQQALAHVDFPDQTTFPTLSLTHLAQVSSPA